MHHLISSEARSRHAAGRVCLRLLEAQELHDQGGNAGPAGPHAYQVHDQPWQVTVQGAGGVRGISGFQVRAEGLLLQNAAARAAGWEPAWVQGMLRTEED